MTLLGPEMCAIPDNAIGTNNTRNGSMTVKGIGAGRELPSPSSEYAGKQLPYSIHVSNFDTCWSDFDG